MKCLSASRTAEAGWMNGPRTGREEGGRGCACGPREVVEEQEMRGGWRVVVVVGWFFWGYLGAKRFRFSRTQDCRADRPRRAATTDTHGHILFYT